MDAAQEQKRSALGPVSNLEAGGQSGLTSMETPDSGVNFANPAQVPHRAESADIDAGAGTKNDSSQVASASSVDEADPPPTQIDPDKVFDDGLALERTTLAWQRSVLALAVVGALVPKYGIFGEGQILPNFFGVGLIFCAFTLLGWVRWRYRKTHHALIQTGKIQGRDAKPLIVVLVLALITAALALGSAIFQ